MREALTAFMCLAGPVRTRAGKLERARQILEEEVLPQLAVAVNFGDQLHGYHGKAVETAMELKSIVRKIQEQPELVGSLISNLNKNHDMMDGYGDVLEDARRSTDDTVKVVKELAIGLEFTHMTLHAQAATLTEQEGCINNAHHLLMDFEA